MEGPHSPRGRRGRRIEGRNLSEGRARTLLAILAVATAATVVSLQLFVHPIVGLADNGDFAKIMAPAGLAYETDVYGERYWNWALVKFAIVPAARFPGEYRSSETLFAKAAVEVSRWLRPGKEFDIRILGMLHLAVFAAFVGLIAAATRDLPFAVQCALLALTVFFFTDVGYVAEFNSLYSQTASLLFLLLTIGVTAVAIRRGKLDGPWLVLYFGCAALFVCSKPQEFLHGPLLAFLGLGLAGGTVRRWWRQPAVWFAAGLCVLSLTYYFAIPRRAIREVGLYHTVFMELLPRSPDPARDLDELGLDRGLLRYSGVNAYQAEAPLAIPEFRRQFFERCGYAKVLAFYLRHPARFFDRLELAGRGAFDLRPGQPGNYDRRAGFPPQARTSRFSAWSSLRSRLGGRTGIVAVVALLAGSLATSVWLLPPTRRGRLARAALVLFVAVALLEFVVCSFADYLGDVSRHLYAFQGLWDALLLANLTALACAVRR